MSVFEFLKDKSKLEFSTMTSMEKVIQATSRSELVPIYLVSPKFGGAKEEENVVYVPCFIAEIMQKHEEAIEKLFSQGKVKKYSVSPKYKKGSYVPYCIEIIASGKTYYSRIIEIW